MFIFMFKQDMVQFMWQLRAAFAICLGYVFLQFLSYLRFQIQVWKNVSKWVLSGLQILGFTLFLPGFRFL